MSSSVSDWIGKTNHGWSIQSNITLSVHSIKRRLSLYHKIKEFVEKPIDRGRQLITMLPGKLSKLTVNDPMKYNYAVGYMDRTIPVGGLYG